MMRPPRGLGLPRADRHRPNPAACLEPNVVDSKFVKYPSVVIVRGKTISGPQTVLSFTSPAAKINQIRCERFFCQNSLLFPTNVFISAFFCRMFNFGGIMQNISIFDQRRSNIHISVTDDQEVRVAARTILRRKIDFSMWPPSEVQQSYEVRSHASRSCRICSHALTWRQTPC